MGRLRTAFRVGADYGRDMSRDDKGPVTCPEHELSSNDRESPSMWSRIEGTLIYDSREHSSLVGCAPSGQDFHA